MFTSSVDLNPHLTSVLSKIAAEVVDKWNTGLSLKILYAAGNTLPCNKTKLNNSHQFLEI